MKKLTVIMALLCIMGCTTSNQVNMAETAPRQATEQEQVEETPPLIDLILWGDTVKFLFEIF